MAPDIASVKQNSRTSGVALSRAWTAAIDSWLSDLWEGTVARQDKVALVAVGGYGRGDLCPGSDLDLMLLHTKRAQIDGLAEAIWYPIWDAGFKLGHSLRTPASALELAAGDLDTATSLLTCRHIAGDRELVASMAERAIGNWKDNSRSNILAVVDRVLARHAEVGEVAFLLEPDLKFGRGGLRDIHALRWIQTARPMMDPIEIESLFEPHATLLAARVELQRRTGRHNDELLLQEQDEVAAALGIADADELMRQVSQAARSVAWTLDGVFHRVERAPGRLKRTNVARQFGFGISISDGTLRLDENVDIIADPVLMLRVADVAARENAFIDRRVLDRLQRDAPTMSETWPAGAREVFIDLLLTGHRSVGVLEALDQVDLLTRIIPEWAPNRSRPQRNAYHRFTVDRHLLEAAAEAARLVDQVDRPDLLVLGGLLHDIGKGYPGDHSVTGVDLVTAIAGRMGYDAKDIDTLCDLVRYHLLLPDVATRRDIEDDGTIKYITDTVGSVETLQLLGALTEADSIATGPSAWGAWKAEIVQELVLRATAVMEGNSVESVTADFPTPELLALVRSKKRLLKLDGDNIILVTPDRPGLFSRVAGALTLHGVHIHDANLHTDDGWALEVIRVSGGFVLSEESDQVLADVDRALKGRIALRARLAERARTYRAHRATTARPMAPQVVVDNTTSATATVIEVRCPDSVGLLYRVSRAISELDLDIVRSKAQTLGHDVVDTFYLIDADGHKITDDSFLEEIELGVLSAIAADG